MSESEETSNTYLKGANQNVDLDLPGFLEECGKLLLHQVDINVSGSSVSGVLTHVRTDHLILVRECQIYIIPMRNIAFISSKS
jgi:hypothetical protein